MPSKVPRIPPVIESVESLSPEWLTTASVPFSQSSENFNAQYREMANASSPGTCLLTWMLIFV